MADNHQNKLDKGIEAGLRVNPWFDFDAEAAWNEFSDAITSDAEMNISVLSKSKPEISWVRFLKYAAVLIVIFGIFVFISRPVEFTKTIMTQNNTENISLFDGSGIEIAENTILRYPVREKGVTVRRVVLEKGKATFRVAKGDLPFLVYAHPLEIKVTGTVFTVEKNVFGVFVTNEEGKVEVYKPNSKISPVQLEKGDKVKIEEGEIHTALGGNEFQQVTFLTSKSLIKIEKMQKDSIALAQAKPKLSENKDIIKGSKYRMTDVISFLEKTYKKQLKFKKKRKLKTDTVVMLQLDQPLDEILKRLKSQDVILFEPGKKAGEYIVSPPEKKEKK